MVGTLTLCPPYRPCHDLSFSRRDASEFFHQFTPIENRGRRECRVRAAPMVRVQQKARGRTTGSAGAAGIPCAMVLTACFVLSPVRPGFVVTVALRHLAERGTCIGAPGPHDFAVRVMWFVKQHAASIASRFQRP
jgi:hypothetical protein